MEKVREDCFEEAAAEGVEERLAERLLKTAIWESRRVAEAGEIYEGVEDYDPVLRSHCRLG